MMVICGGGGGQALNSVKERQLPRWPWVRLDTHSPVQNTMTNCY